MHTRLRLHLNQPGGWDPAVDVGRHPGVGLLISAVAGTGVEHELVVVEGRRLWNPLIFHWLHVGGCLFMWRRLDFAGRSPCS
jgi:hypothetical protein